MGMRPAPRMPEWHWWTPWVRMLARLIIVLAFFATVFGVVCLAVWLVG